MTMKHTWSFVRKSDVTDHPKFFEMTDYELMKWVKCKGIFRSKQTGETTHRKIKMDGLTFWAKVHFGMTHEEARA